MGLLAEGQSMLNRRMKASEGINVTYSRKVGNATQTVNLVARPGRTLFSGLTESAVTVQWGERDMLIEVADLILNGSPTTPQKGDRIQDGAVVWELSSPQTDEACWRYSDQQTRTLYRVHLKRVG